MEDEAGYVRVGVHFGSRGFGHKTASGFVALAQGRPFDGHAAEGGMDSLVVDKVLEMLSADAVHEVHNHHNFAWREEHDGRTYWVIRNGCTPGRPGQEGFVGGSMGDESVMVARPVRSRVHAAGHGRRRNGPTDVERSETQNQKLASACSRSATRSSGSSTPQLRRTRSGGTAAAESSTD